MVRREPPQEQMQAQMNFSKKETSFSEKFKNLICKIVREELKKLTTPVIEAEFIPPKEEPRRAYYKWSNEERNEICEQFKLFLSDRARHHQRTGAAIKDEIGKRFYGKENY